MEKVPCNICCLIMKKQTQECFFMLRIANMIIAGLWFSPLIQMSLCFVFMRITLSHPKSYGSVPGCLARRQQDYQLHGKMYGTDRTKQIPDITREPRKHADLRPFTKDLNNTNGIMLIPIRTQQTKRLEAYLRTTSSLANGPALLWQEETEWPKQPETQEIVIMCLDGTLESDSRVIAVALTQ
ncbi:hypothetical protein QZH41_007262 [Actinostola sp. cb2023]|nr:hypothetical protein QZH41_007262 [Actinostola sp. cb2023]